MTFVALCGFPYGKYADESDYHIKRQCTAPSEIGIFKKTSEKRSQHQGRADNDNNQHTEKVFVWLNKPPKLVYRSTKFCKWISQS